VGEADPLAVALVTPVTSEGSGAGPESTGTAAGPAIDSERIASPGRRTLTDVTVDMGGTADVPSADQGLPQRIARRQADPVRLTPGRYVNRSEGGARTRPGRERRPAPAFAPRSERLDAAPP